MSDDLTSQIRRQVESYFSGLNLRRDKFMREKMSADPEGFLPIETLMTFKRLLQLSSDVNVVVEAMKTSDQLTFNEDFTKVKSNVDLRKPENNVSLRTVHIRGFPTSATLDDLIEGLKSYGNIRFIEMRRFMKEKTFKGSCNIEFGTKEEAEEFMRQKIMFAGVELTDKEMLADREANFEERNKRYTFSQKSIVQFKNIGAETSTAAFKELLQPYLDDYCLILREDGDEQAVVRFTTGEMAAKAIEELKGKQLGEKPLRMNVLTGKKANIMWTKIKSQLQKEEGEKTESRKREHTEEMEGEKKAKTNWFVCSNMRTHYVMTD